MTTLERWACLVAVVLAGTCPGPVAVLAAAEAEPMAGAAPPVRAERNAMKIRILAKGWQSTAELEDSAAARDLAALLPLELTLRDYHGTEKIADLPTRLSTHGAPDGIDPAIGDIAYYAPWRNVAIYYRDFGYSRGLVRLGRVEGDVSGLAGKDPIVVRIENIATEAHQAAGSGQGD
jgi:hypothetical protein